MVLPSIRKAAPFICAGVLVLAGLVWLIVSFPKRAAPVSKAASDFALPITASTPTWASHCRGPLREFLRDAWSVDAIQDPKVLAVANELIDHHTGLSISADDDMVETLRANVKKHPALMVPSLQFINHARLAYIVTALEKEAKAEPHLPLLRWQMWSLVAGRFPTEENTARALHSLYEMLDHSKGLASVPDFIAVQILLESAFSRNFFALEHAEISQIVSGHASTPLWLRECVAGYHHHQAILDAAHHLKKFPKSKEAVREYRRHLELGMAALRRSWEVNPTVPETAATLMLLTAVSGDAGNESRKWLGRSLRLRADCINAYANQLGCLEQRKDIAGLEAFGEACLRTGRFDTAVPAYFFHAHCFRQKLGQHPERYWGNLSEDDVAGFEELFDGLSTQPNREAHQTMRAVYCLWRGDATGMDQCLTGLEGLNEVTLNDFGFSVDEFEAAAGNLRASKTKAGADFLGMRAPVTQNSLD